MPTPHHPILAPHLQRFRRRLLLRDGWILAQRSLWIPCAVALAVLLAGRLWPIEHLRLWSVLPVAAWLASILTMISLRPFPPMRVARRVDLDLDLKERLSTALALADDVHTLQRSDAPTFQPTLVALQRQDALSAVQGIDPRQAFPLPWLRRPLLLAGTVLAAVAIVAALPNPMSDVLTERSAVAEVAQAQARRIEELQARVQQTETLTPEEKQAILGQLAELVEQLRANSGDREQALADISRVEEALARRLPVDPDLHQSMLDNLSAQLQALAQRQAGNDVASPDTAQALRALAESMAQMNDAQKQVLAQELAQLAAAAAQGGETSLGEALAALAQAIQVGDRTGAAASAQASTGALEAAAQQVAGQLALKQVLAQVQTSRQALARAGSGATAGTQENTQSPGTSTAQGQGQVPGQGQPGSGGGTQANTLPPGTRPGRAARPRGEGQGSGEAPLSPQIYVPPERRSGSGEEVFVPGQDSGQGKTQVRQGQEPLPGAASPALVPYQAVYYQYLDAAGLAMERSEIPASLENYVRDYFTQLEP